MAVLKAISVTLLVTVFFASADPNPFHYPAHILDQIIERTVEDEVRKIFPDDVSNDGSNLNQKYVQFDNINTDEYGVPNAENKANQNVQQDQGQKAIPIEIIRKKFLENFYDVERVPEEVIKKSKKAPSKLVDGTADADESEGSLADYFTGDGFAGSLYSSSYKAYPYDYEYKPSEDLSKSNYDDAEDSSDENDGKEKAEKKPKDSFFVQEYSTGYNQEWNEKDSDKNVVPDKRGI